jgi:hypothetical protein
VLTSIERATLIVIPDNGDLTDYQTQALLDLGYDTDPCRVVVSVDWIIECLDLDRLVDIAPFRMHIAEAGPAAV